MCGLWKALCLWTGEHLQKWLPAHAVLWRAWTVQGVRVLNQILSFVLQKS
jgi:hypothetical protein